ncbi:mCG16643 [Mus musculus]|nr:mCG16643 [Mus musculus]
MSTPFPTARGMSDLILRLVPSWFQDSCSNSSHCIFPSWVRFDHL